MTENEKLKVDELRNNGLGYGKIAIETGINVNTIKSYCQRSRNVDRPQFNNGTANNATVNNITGTISGNTNTTTSTCLYCGKEIVNHSYREKKFCSDECRMKYWTKNRDKLNLKKTKTYTCKCCNKEFKAPTERKYCSIDCYVKGRFKNGVCSDNDHCKAVV